MNKSILLVLFLFLTAGSCLAVNQPAAAQSSDCPTEDFLEVSADANNTDYPEPELSVSCGPAAMTVTGNGIINHEFVAMNARFDMGEQSYTFRIPRTVTLLSEPATVEAGGTIGVMINGIPIFSANESEFLGWGDPYLDGELDFCNGHTGPGDKYHYHAAPQCLIETWETVGAVVGYAFDGHPILTPFECADEACTSFVELQSGWELTNPEAEEAWVMHTYTGAGDLDECNGKTLEDGSYAYFATATFPYTLGCMMGEEFSGSETTTAVQLTSETVRSAAISIVSTLAVTLTLVTATVMTYRKYSYRL